MSTPAYNYQKVADLLKEIDKLKEHIKFVKHSSQDGYKASVYLLDGSSVVYYLSPNALLIQLRAKLKDLQARLTKAKAALV